MRCASSVNNSEAIRIAVGRQTDIAPVLNHGRRERLQLRHHGFRVHAPEQRIRLTADRSNRKVGVGKQFFEQCAPGAMHRVHQHVEPGPGNPIPLEK